MKAYKKGVVLLVLSTALLFAGCGLLSKADSQDAGERQVNQRQPMQRPAFSEEETRASLAELVKDQSISQEQADSVLEHLKKQAEERDSITPEEMEKRREEMQESRGKKGAGGPGQRPDGSVGPRMNQLSELVEKGTITQEQAEKISEKLFKGRGMRPNQEN